MTLRCLIARAVSRRLRVRAVLRLLAVTVLAVAPAHAAEPAQAAEPAAGSPPKPAGYVALYTRVLERYTASAADTVGTTVDYHALAREPGSETWRDVKAALAAAKVPTQWDEKLALWINAYNILAIDMVLRHYPVESIRDIGSFFTPVWRLDAGKVAGIPVTLHEIEHGILRPMGDPRIHAAIVCASTSCPSLARAPYSAAGIQAELDRAMERWLASKAKGLRVDRKDRRVVVSRIFRWFEDDWNAIGGIRAAVLRYAPDADHAWLETHLEDADLEYFDYDWTLNATGP